MMGGSFYLARGSPVHRLDPRPKLALLLVALLLAVSTGSPWAPAGVLAAGMSGVAIARAWPALFRVRGLMATAFLFSLVIWSLLPLATSRPPSGAGALGTRQALPLMGVITGLKLVAMIVCSVLFLATTRNEELTLGLIRLGLPYPVAFAFATALRLVPALVATAVTIIQAQQARGLDAASGSWLARARKHVPLLIPIVASTLRSTQTFAMALEARGFRARPSRTSLLTLRLTPADWAALALAVALLVLAVVLRAVGG